jgi:LemA protein
MIALTVLIIHGIFLAVVIFGIAIYNKLIRLRNTVKSSWADIDVQRKRDTLNGMLYTPG